MKRLFDKVYFSAELLSSEYIVSGVQNEVKFLISDTIGQTEIDTVSFRLRTVKTTDRTEATVTTILNWTDLDVTNEDRFNVQFTPTFVNASDIKVIADIKVTDLQGNVYYLTNSLFKLKVL